MHSSFEIMKTKSSHSEDEMKIEGENILIVLKQTLTAKNIIQPYHILPEYSKRLLKQHGSAI
jgi:hypothetical protein